MLGLKPGVQVETCDGCWEMPCTCATTYPAPPIEYRMDSAQECREEDHLNNLRALRDLELIRREDFEHMIQNPKQTLSPQPSYGTELTEDELEELYGVLLADQGDV